MWERHRNLSGLWAEIEENSGNCSAQVTRDRQGWLSVEKRNYGQVFESLGLELIRTVFESWLCHILAVWLWAYYLTHMYHELHHLINKIYNLTVSMAQCSGHSLCSGPHKVDIEMSCGGVRGAAISSKAHWFGPNSIPCGFRIRLWVPR